MTASVDRILASTARTHRAFALSAATLLLAGTALVPAAAQVADLGGLTRVTFDFANFNPPGIGIIPAEITNGTVRASITGSVTYGGNLTDSIGLLTFRKEGAGTLTLSGVNTHGGNTVVSNGTLQLGSATALSANSALFIGGPVGVAAILDMNGFSGAATGLLATTGRAIVTAGSGPATLTINTALNRVYNGGLQGALSIVKDGAGIQTFNGSFEPGLAPTTMTGTITLNAGGISIGSDNALGTGNLIVNGAGTLTTGTIGLRLFDNDIVLNNALTVLVGNGREFNLGGDIGGTGSLVKTGIGTLRLLGDNSYSGGTTLTAGRVELGGNNALGTGLVTVTGVTTLAATNPAFSLSVANDFNINAQDLRVETGNAGSVFELTGDIVGSRNIIIGGGSQGTLRLAGDNGGHTGTIAVDSGVLELASAGAAGSATAIRLANATTLSIDAAGVAVGSTIASRTGSGAVEATINTNAFNATITGQVRDHNAALGDTLGITKDGSGILTLAFGDLIAGTRNELTGGLTVAEGTVNLTGVLAGNVSVENGATFAGTGTQIGTLVLQTGGILSAGNALGGAGSVGTLTVDTLVMSAGSNVNFDLGAPGMGDLVVVTGPLQLGGLLNVNGLSGFSSGTYTLFTHGNAVSGSLGLGMLPAGYGYSVVVGSGAVNLQVSITDFYWDGAGPAGNGVVNGGTGTWSAAGTNWTNQTGVGTEAWQNGGNAFFTGTGGTVTLADSFTYGALNFQGNGYVLSPAAAQTLTAAGGVIDVSAGNTATINTVLAGTGGLAKNGSGTLVLTGANTVTGGITINGGTLAVTNAAALGPDALFINGGTQTLRFDSSMTVANTINASGIGYNIDTGANTVILNGSLSGGGADKLGSGTLVLNNAINAQPNTLAVFNGTLIVNGGVQGGVSGGLNSTIGGTGTITGTLAMSGTLSPGAAAGQVGTLTVGALSLNASSTSLFDLGALGGVNDLVVSTGALTINGTLNVNPLAGWNIGTGSYTLFTYAGALTNNGLDLGASLTSGLPTGVSYAIDTSVAGQVNLVRSYAGAFNWDGNGAAVDGVVTGGAGTWNGSASNWANADGTFNLAYVDAADTVANFGGAAGGAVTLAGGRTAGTINFTTGGYMLTGAALTLAGDATISVASAISAMIDSEVTGVDGLTKTGAGTLVLNAANSYTGGTALAAGTIVVGNNLALSTGGLAMAGGTTLTAGAAGLTLANAISTAGVGTIDTGANTLTLGGVISGAGAIAKVGSGTLVLNGANTYAGGTALNAGGITVGNSAALGTGALAMAGGTRLTAGAAGLALANAVSTAGVGTIDTGINTLTLGGVISGAGSIAKIGTGTLVLNGANTYAGGTALNAGSIQVGNNTALGSGTLAMAAGTGLVAGAPDLAVANAVTLAGQTFIGNAATFTLNGVVSGTGRFDKIGAGTLVLNGANSFSGGASISEGAIQVGTSTALGSGALTMVGGTRLISGAAGLSLANAITTLGVGTIDTGANTLTLGGVVSGAGSIAKIGTGTLVLNGANTHAGGTALSAGAITVGTSNALGTGALTAADGTTLNAGVSGLTLANAVTLNGNLTVNTGTSPATLAMSGVIGGAGGITKTGTGTLTLSGASTYAGPTTVSAGTLNVTGSLASAVTVNSGATITGTGSMGALTVSAGASISPGAPGTNDVGTLTVNGPASLLGTYTVNVIGATSDRVVATGALTVGGTLAVGTVTGSPIFNQTYTIASGASRTGTFNPVNGLSLFGPALNATVEYTATAVNIRLAPGSLVASANAIGGATGNALEVARAFDRAVANGYNPQAFAAVYTSGAALPRTLLQMSGEQRATERRVVLETSRVFRETALDRLNLGLASMAGQQVAAGDADTGAVTFWLRGAGSWGTADTSGAATGFTTEQRGLLTGIDWAKDGITVGAMFHYTSTDIDYRVLGGSSNVETTGGTFYAGYRKPDRGLVANAGVSVAGARSTGARAITLPGFTQSLQGRTTGTTYQVFGELAYDLAGSSKARIEPFARLTYVQADMNALTETNGVAALSAAKQSLDLAVTNLGLRVGTGLGEKVSVNASAAWQRTSGAREATTIIGIPAVGQNGAIQSVALDPDAALLQADIGFNLSDSARINVGYSGLIGKNNSDHAGRATLSFSF